MSDFTDGPGAMRMKGSHFDGMTLAAIAALSSEEARRLGYWREGLKYVEWLASDRNQNLYTRTRAASFLADRRQKGS